MKINIEYEVVTKIEKNGWVSCYIPDCEIHFSVKNVNDIEKRAKILIISYSHRDHKIK